MSDVANLYRSLGRDAEAIKLNETTLALMKAKMPDHHFTFNCMEGLAASYHNLGRHADALKLYEETLRLRKTKLGPDHPQTLHSMNELAWLLATCPDVKLRDPRQAVAHAKKAVELAPARDDLWNTLGVAQYRNGEWKAAVEALMKSVQLREGGGSFDFFFLAMAHWQLNEKDKARAWYDRAVAWMDKHEPNDKDLKRFRAEATALLGLAKAAQTQKK
jgi:uncharacterized protein HemY